MTTSDHHKIYELNLSALRERWPLLAKIVDESDLASYQFEITLGDTATVSVNNIQLSSRHDAQAEAEVQASVVPDAKTIYLYGFGLGFLANHLLNTRPEIERLEVKITNSAIFKFVLQILDISHIISNERIVISLASIDKKAFSPFFAHPESLTLCDDETLKVRDYLAHAVRLNYNNSFFSSDKELLKRTKTFKFHKNGKAKPISTLFKLNHPGRACIIGSGPSLEDNIEKLKIIRNQSSGNIIIACDTAMVALNSYGIHPDFVVTIDKKIDINFFKKCNTKNTALVFHPTTSKNLIDAWLGPKFYAISSSFLCDHLKKTEAINTLITNGSVIHPAIDLGVAMGYKEIILFGADFSFIKNKTHAYWPSEFLGGNINSEYWIFNGKGEKVRSAPNMAAYLITTENLISKNKNVKFYNTSLDGAKIDGTIQI